MKKRKTELTENEQLLMFKEFLDGKSNAIIARMFDMQPQAISYHRKKNGWDEKRKAILKAAYKEITDSKIAEHVDLVKNVNKALRAVVSAIDDGTIETPKLGDMDKLTRLLLFLQGEADSRGEQTIEVNIKSVED